MRLTVNVFLTADGVMQGPGRPDKDTSSGFERGGWQVPYFDDAFGAIVGGWSTKAQAILLGRTTYDLSHPYWRQVTNPDDLVASKAQRLPKYVVSTTLTDPAWENTTVISEDLADTVSRLKQTGEGELQVHGSCGLVKTSRRQDWSTSTGC